ncbi:peptidoglycan L-alanyl-D-glutamate endopeptidase CwlK [Gracilibacillus ureilyticus]|uniref:Peptidoglycan L-alanyl-D-glutamate endopeptidase CwlK n=1 Tax=Gracilibacillus ureilyticus TaxID=531814 RepID=A0A1H9NJZ0_9BACI|nr:M15 family metallopeptidase [Gracilibacillus ureilyticus]SER36304.1 peptidoglycan L-alanyl-D-glutamate endopeptidase CwlK [Gracilibacillus ureilyticus]
MKIRTIFILIVIIAVGSMTLHLYNTYQEYSNRPMPTDLHPVVEDAMEQLVNKSEEKGIPILITDDFRSVEEQNAIYARGRSEGGTVVTNAKGGESYHNYGLAIDFAIQPNPGEAIWDLEYDGNNNGESDWMEVVSIAKSLGFSWGGDFTQFKDYPHLQMDFGLSIRELQMGKRPEDVIDKLPYYTTVRLPLDR